MRRHRRRARRILPAYWVSLAVLVPLTAPTFLQSADGLKRLALLGSVQQYVDRQLPGEVNRVYWSLTTEVHFYVLLPVLAYLLFRFRGRALLPVCLAASVAWRLWKPEDAAESLIFGRIDQFVAGIAAAGLVAAFDAGRPGRLMRWLLTRHTFWVIVGVIVAAGIYQGGSHLSRTGPMTGFELVHPIAGLAFAGLIARATCRAREPRRLAAPSRPWASSVTACTCGTSPSSRAASTSPASTSRARTPGSCSSPSGSSSRSRPSCRSCRSGGWKPRSWTAASRRSPSPSQSACSARESLGRCRFPPRSDGRSLTSSGPTTS